MNYKHDGDEKLIHFLRTNAPVAPAASAALEDKIHQAVSVLETEAHQENDRYSFPIIRKYSKAAGWSLLALLVLSLIPFLSWDQHAATPNGDRDSLEDFAETSWDSFFTTNQNVAYESMVSDFYGNF